MGKKKKQQGPAYEKHMGVVALYTSKKYTTEQIAAYYKIGPRQVQRIAAQYGVIRTQSEANKAMAPLKKYHFTPPELRQQRKHLTLKQRYLIISKHPYCKVCGDAGAIGIRLEIDHKDNDPTNNISRNLQVLCQRCNQGKYQASRKVYL